MTICSAWRRRSALQQTRCRLFSITAAPEEEIEEMLYDPELFHEMTGELLYAY